MLHLLISNLFDTAQLGFVGWWLFDLAPLSGQLRFVFYVIMLLLAYFSRSPIGDSPLQCPEIYGFTNPEFYTPYGLMKSLNIRWKVSHLKVIRNITLAAWVLTAFGFMGPITALICGFGFCILQGINTGLIGTSHRWYVPAYAMVFLALSDSDPRCSLDGYLSQQISWWPFPTTNVVLNSGFARKLIAMAAVSTLFGGGIAKIVNGGFRWTDGHSMQFYVTSSSGHWKWLKKMLSEHLIFCQLLAIGTIIFEFGSIVALFSQQLRPMVYFSAAGLHLGIWLTMWPDYTPQTLCYALGMSWGESFLSTGANITDWTVQLSLVFGVLFAACLLVVCIFRIEHWPFTGVPMYSMYRGTDFSQGYIKDIVQAQYLAAEFIKSGYPQVHGWSKEWITLRVTNRSRETFALSSQFDILNTGVLPKHLNNLLRIVAAEDISAKSKGRIQMDPSDVDTPGTKFLQKIVPWCKKVYPYKDDDARVELICNLARGPVILSAVRLSDSKLPPTNTLNTDFYWQ